MTLAAAIADADWPRALSIALDLWRATRSPQVADLVDTLGARCGTPPPAVDVHAWWLEHARYVPEMVTPLVEHADVEAHGSAATWAAIRERWPDSPIVGAFAGEPGVPTSRNWIERVAAILAWPDDPRAARVLARWLASHELHVRGPAFAPVYRAIADRLAQLADVRVLPQLAVLDRRPEQLALVERVSSALEHVSVAPAPALPDVPPLASELELARLWRAVGDHPEDLASRAVLGDALAASGDARGELIALQLAEPDAKRARRIERLIATWWTHWLGEDLASIVLRDGSELRGGMLETLRVGHPQTPREAWSAVRGHRELRTVHTVVPWRVPAVGYAHFLAGLEHVTTVELDAPETATTLASLGARLPVTALAYTRPPSVDTFRALAPVVPDLARVALDPDTDELGQLVSELPALFPELRAIELLARSNVAARELTARFTGESLVRVRR